jgi:serine phosphatase RsbU (regulator of sigma subunit)
LSPRLDVDSPHSKVPDLSRHGELDTLSFERLIKFCGYRGVMAVSVMEQSTEPPVSIWDPPPGVELNVGWRHLIALVITIGVGTLVGGLGTLSFSGDDIPTGFAPAAAVQVVAGTWFGGWGVAAGVIFPALVRSMAGPDNSPGRVLADLIVSGLPALWFRYSRRDPRLISLRDRIVFLVVVVGATNLLAASAGTSYLMLVDSERWSVVRWLKAMLAWAASGAGPCLVLGLPLLRTLSPVITRSSLFCRNWWQSAANVGPSMRRFRHQPIIVKIMLGLTAAGFVPLLIVVAVGLWDDYQHARRQAMDAQQRLAAEIETDLEKILAQHEELVEQLSRNPLAESMVERTSALSSFFPTVTTSIQYMPLQTLQESQVIDNEQAQDLAAGKTVAGIGPGPLPKRNESINLMRLITTGDRAGTVVLDSIGLNDLENSLFDVARQRGHEYAMFDSSGRQIIASPKFRRTDRSKDEDEFTEAGDGGALLYHRRDLQKPGWQLELVIPQASGVKGVLARQRDYTAVITSLALFAALVVGGYLARALERPIRDLTRTMRQAGRLDVEIEAAVHGHDEVGELASSFNEMSRQLRRSIAALERTTAEKERLSYEFELAAELQRRILPARPPSVVGFDIAGLCVPAREVGGDFYDWHLLSDIRLGLLIGDACGKGMGAAFLINEARSIAVAHLQDTPSAGAVLRRTNHTLFQSRAIDDTFTTMFCMLLSVPSRRLNYASAGHPPAVLYRPTTGEMAGLDTMGRPLGLDSENPIESEETNLMIGDVVVAFTDGVLDATNPAGEPFGRLRLEQLVRDNHSVPAAELARLIERAVLEYCGTSAQFDDLTLLVIRSVESEAPPDVKA